MRRKLMNFGLVAGLLLLVSCFGQHNKAPSEGVNLDSERVYGESREAPPAQLPNQYPEPTPETLERIQKIQQKFFPE